MFQMLTISIEGPISGPSSVEAVVRIPLLVPNKEVAPQRGTRGRIEIEPRK